MLEKWNQKARDLRRDTYAIWLACRDPRVPWYARALAAAVLTYALSPIDLIPDFVPVLGYLDDLVVIPGGLVLVRKMIPDDVMAEHRATAAARLPSSKLGALIVVGIWLLVLAALLVLFTR